MKKPREREHGLHYLLVAKARAPCPSCGGEQGWHQHPACEGMKRRWGSCIVTHVDKKHGTRHCRLPNGWDVAHRLSRRGVRLHFHQYTGEGLYCEHHARELAAQANRPIPHQVVA